ncbi:hypothetical protein DSO57_1001106 [Entomophthora muscae]|uniref:Uncharacterized protein n=1 Tax=Entomophthora muscae TaxID=34485 RepID=A0ACC2SAY9_9FUNG|nr:hypothetical protein DSO57_1001106 [Entomophthora muscae]
MSQQQEPYYGDSMRPAMNTRLLNNSLAPSYPRPQRDSQGFSLGPNNSSNPTPQLGSSHPEYPGQGLNPEMQYGHFAITTARYPEPWLTSPMDSYSQFLPAQSAPRSSLGYGQFGQPVPSAFSINDALMMPPPSPNILSYYMYDHAMNFQQRNFQQFQLPSLWNPGIASDPSNLAQPQYVLPPIQPHPSSLTSGLNQFIPKPAGYSMYNPQWGPRWGSTAAGQRFGVNPSQFPPGYPQDALQQAITHNATAYDPRHQLGTYAPVDMSGAVPTYSIGYSAPSMHAPLVLVPGTNVSIKDAGTMHWRDHLLQYAHSIYSTTPQSPTLLPMLNTLNQLHPNHLPILLLTACVHYAQGNYSTSLKFHFMILEIDPTYVEAMSNIGTTLRSMGKDKEAEQYWRKAIKLKPTYWDAIENLLGLLSMARPADPAASQPRYDEAYQVCCFVELHVLGSIPFEEYVKTVSQRLPATYIPRLQNLLYIKGNMRYAVGKVDEARVEYEKALCLVFGGLSLMEVIAHVLRLHLHPHPSARAEELARFDFGSTGNVLLEPNDCLQVSARVFPETSGVLPGLIELTRTADASHQAAFTSANQTASAILLTLAKLYQDTCVNPQPLPLLLPLYYLSMSLSPSPSTCNNLGILLSNIPASPQGISGTALALQYYTYGLNLDPRHPHLFTNLGSLLKDMGNITEAIRMYERAVECNPKFDVALANLGNALKDSGRTQDSIQWYRKAVEINPDFTEAVCGLVNALGGVCNWRGRSSYTDPISKITHMGWVDRIAMIVDKQLTQGAEWGRGALQTPAIHDFLGDLARAFQHSNAAPLWTSRLQGWVGAQVPNEGGWMVRATEHALRHLQRQWYLSFYRQNHYAQHIDITILAPKDVEVFRRPALPRLPLPALPTVLPFHTFTYPLTPRQIRLISHRNALRISHSVLTASWLPPTVYPPPPPPVRRIRLGYVSSDFNNHPLAHLMQSVFGFHDRSRFEVFCYATTPPDMSPYRAKIQSSTQNFLDVSGWSTQAIVERVVHDGIHILINLNGYTKGARNEVFAARPAPVLMAYMGFAGTLGGNWCDWFIADPVVCPPNMVASDQSLMREPGRDRMAEVDSLDLDPEENSDSWVYTERLIYLPHSYFVNDHRQGFRDPEDASFTEGRIPPHPLNRPRELLELDWVREESRRWRMRREIFPMLGDDTVIFANFNQLYKIDPAIFKVWLQILSRVPNSILWLLRFPAAGEPNLKETAEELAGREVASRVIFTDVAPKQIHIHRGRIADLFLDTTECNAHTTAADILWSGTPIVTYARHIYKMCSRVAASIAYATGYGEYMVTDSEEAYADQAVKLASSLSYRYAKATNTQVVLERLGLTNSHHLPVDHDVLEHRFGQGELMDLRKALFLTRDHSRLFDTPRWVRNLEQGYTEAWKRWESGDDDKSFPLTYQPPPQNNTPHSPAYLAPRHRNHIREHLQESWSQGRENVMTGCIWVQDDDDDHARARAAAATSLNSNLFLPGLGPEQPSDNLAPLPTGDCAMPSA